MSEFEANLPLQIGFLEPDSSWTLNASYENDCADYYDITHENDPASSLVALNPVTDDRATKTLTTVLVYGDGEQAGFALSQDFNTILKVTHKTSGDVIRTRTRAISYTNDCQTTVFSMNPNYVEIHHVSGHFDVQITDLSSHIVDTQSTEYGNQDGRDRCSSVRNFDLTNYEGVPEYLESLSYSIGSGSFYTQL